MWPLQKDRYKRMRQVGTHSLNFVYSCDMHIIVHVLTHTHPHTLTHSHHSPCTSHIIHYTLHNTHTYMDNTCHACGTVHCTTDPQAHTKKTHVDRNSIGHRPIGSHTNHLILSIICWETGPSRWEMRRTWCCRPGESLYTKWKGHICKYMPLELTGAIFVNSPKVILV